MLLFEVPFFLHIATLLALKVLVVLAVLFILRKPILRFFRVDEIVETLKEIRDELKSKK